MAAMDGITRVPLHLPRHARAMWLEGYQEGQERLRRPILAAIPGLAGNSSRTTAQKDVASLCAA